MIDDDAKYLARRVTIRKFVREDAEKDYTDKALAVAWSGEWSDQVIAELRVAADELLAAEDALAQAESELATYQARLSWRAVERRSDGQEIPHVVG